MLAALGGCDAQVKGHVAANLNVGNSRASCCRTHRSWCRSSATPARSTPSPPSTRSHPRPRKDTAHAEQNSRPDRRLGQPAVPGHHDVRPVGERTTRPTPSASSTAPWTPASTSSTPPTSTPRASPNGSSARPSPGAATTSCWPPSSSCRWADDPNQRGGSRRWIIRAVEDSLRRLDTDYIDLYQVHRPSQDTDIEETLGALTDLVRQGKVRYIGSSSYAASQIVEAQWTARDRQLERFVTEQPPYSIMVRGIEADVLPTARGTGWAS